MDHMLHRTAAQVNKTFCADGAVIALEQVFATQRGNEHLDGGRQRAMLTVISTAGARTWLYGPAIAAFEAALAAYRATLEDLRTPDEILVDVDFDDLRDTEASVRTSMYSL